ncbi:MAG: ATP-binding protein [Pseudohongiellaceae bacterium]
MSHNASDIGSGVSEGSLSQADTNGSACETRIPISGVEDIVKARQQGRALAHDLGFSLTQATLIATAISELARNIVLYAKDGEIVIARKNRQAHTGIMVSAIDHGPGIENVRHALMSGYSSSGGLGLGLPGVRQMVDEFEIHSQPGDGTQVTTTMWLK